MYQISVDEINKNVFSDNLICKISNEGLFTFNCIFNVFLYAKLSADGAIPNFDGDKDIANIQKIISRKMKYKIIPISWINRKEGYSKFDIKELRAKYLFTLIYCLLEKLLLKK